MPLHQHFDCSDPQPVLRTHLPDWTIDGHATCWWAHTTIHGIDLIVVLGDGEVFVDATARMPNLAWIWVPTAAATLGFAALGVALWGWLGVALAIVGAVVGTWTGLIAVRTMLPDADAAQAKLAGNLVSPLALGEDWFESETPVSTSFPITSDAHRLDYVIGELHEASAATRGPTWSAANQIASECALHPDSDRMQALRAAE